MNFFSVFEESFAHVSNFNEIPLEVRIDQKEEQEHRLNVTILFGYVCLMILTVLTIWLFHNHRIPFLHESGLVLVYGLIVGIILRFGVNIEPFTTINVIPSNDENATSVIDNLSTKGPPDVMLMDISKLSNDSSYNVYNRTLAYKYQGGILDINNDIRTKTEFDAELFFNILLPPIIFNAGYSMKRRFFFRNIGSIFAFAFVGTTISTFTVAGVMYLVLFLFPYLQKTMSILDLIRFGALISATDPVTTLSIFNDLNVEVNLYALVFGESVLNDAVAIVITRTLEDYEINQLENGQSGFGISAIFGSILQFVYVFGLSFIVGSIIACINALITKFSRIMDLPELESTLLILMSYNAYLLAEMLHLSGIVAVLFCGICQAHYTFNNLSEESKGITRQFASVLNFICENFIFLYVGVSMFVCRTHNYDLPFIIGAFIAIIVGRAANIYPLSFLLNRIRKTSIPWNSQHMMFLSGLRGAIAFGLSVNLTLTPARNIIRTTTQIIILVTVIISGGSTMNVLKWLKIPTVKSNKDDVYQEVNGNTTNQASRGYGAISRSRSVTLSPDPAILAKPNFNRQKSWVAKRWSGIDNTLLKPMLTHAQPTLLETMPWCNKTILKMFTSNEQLYYEDRTHTSMEYHVNHDNNQENNEEEILLLSYRPISS